jgi:hypothetical protein
MISDIRCIYSPEELKKYEYIYTDVVDFERDYPRSDDPTELETTRYEQFTDMFLEHTEDKGDSIVISPDVLVVLMNSGKIKNFKKYVLNPFM